MSFSHEYRLVNIEYCAVGFDGCYYAVKCSTGIYTTDGITEQAVFATDDKGFDGCLYELIIYNQLAMLFSQFVISDKSKIKQTRYISKKVLIHCLCQVKPDKTISTPFNGQLTQ